jgi:putative CocE/NonD family hydrolase
MKKIFSFLFLFTWLLGKGQTSLYKKDTTMIRMRDGIRLFTVIYTPTLPGKFPFMIERTPYGADDGCDTCKTFNFSPYPAFADMARDGYIFVFQDIRGKFKSEGQMEMNKPMYHTTDPSAIDESTDTYDTVDWLVKNVSNNNGKAGIRGVSYDGWLAMVASVDPHPALKAASEQATPADMFLGDDFHHNGAFRLSYGFEYSYLFEHEKESSSFPFPQFDLYDWYLQLGSLKNVNEKYLHRQLPTWNDFTQHPNYDSFWKKRSAMGYVPYPQTAMLHVGGYFDQEDMNGPQLMYRHMEARDSFNRNYIILGPWNHGGWFAGKGDSLGKISFEVKTGEYFRDLQKKWFDYWLKGPDSTREGDKKFDNAYCFQTGSNVWKSYSAWPPKETEIKNLYAAPNNKCSFEKSNSTGFTSYISDPAHPVPYRTPPIEATYGEGSRWYTWQVEDQRFVSSRPDVISFTSDSLTTDLTVTGKIIAHLFASTSGTDADWVVKLIDVYPNRDPKNFLMSQYQFPIAMEVFRGRFRKSFSDPLPLTPNKAEEFVIDLHDINHVFKKGHRLMIQVQSTWFPLIDRNPQKYVPNIFEAKDNDFQKAEQRVYYNTYIELPVAKE